MERGGWLQHHYLGGARGDEIYRDNHTEYPPQLSVSPTLQLVGYFRLESFSLPVKVAIAVGSESKVLSMRSPLPLPHTPLCFP